MVNRTVAPCKNTTAAPCITSELSQVMLDEMQMRLGICVMELVVVVVMVVVVIVVILGLLPGLGPPSAGAVCQLDQRLPHLICFHHFIVSLLQLQHGRFEVEVTEFKDITNVK